VNLPACKSLPRTPENGVWYRLILPSDLPTALSSAHTKLARSRFNAGDLLPASERFASLYFADDVIPAQFEVGAVVGSYEPGHYLSHNLKSFITLNVKVLLHEVFDLTDVNNAQISLDTNVQELTGDWKGYHARTRLTSVSQPRGTPAPTQDLGKELYLTGVEGFRAISAKVPFHRTLTVFTDNLQRGRSSLAFTDPSGNTYRIP
jgi:hypothetical protein